MIIDTQQLHKQLFASRVTIESPLLGNGEVNKLHQQYRLCFPLGLCEVVIEKRIQKLEVVERIGHE
jgi:CO dehydrogenase/acetyl-CoA synthase alpha subunit